VRSRQAAVQRTVAYLMDYSIPQDWIAEAGLDGFMPATQGYRCDEPHSLVALTDIAPIKRDRPLDRNGFVRDRMMAVLRGISKGESIPPIIIWAALAGPPRFELRDGYHRLYASATFGFSHVPADIIDRY